MITRELTANDRPTILDVGAHVGLAATRYRELFPAATVHCFEPYPESFARLESAVGSLARIELYPFALAAAVGESEFSVNQNSATNSLLKSDSGAEIYWRSDTPRTSGSLTVKTSTLDRFCSDRAIRHIDILKMDVQGSEYDVLLGAESMLNQQHIDLVYMELIMAPTYIGQHRLRDYLEIFDGHGYELFDLYNFGRSSGRLLQTDVIFVSLNVLASYEARLAHS